MKLILLPLLLLLSASIGHAETTHRILISGCGLGQISIIGKDGKTEWSTPHADEISDAVLLPNGNILHSIKSEGIREIKPNYETKQGAEIVWTWTPPSLDGKQGETHTCQPLPGNSILTGQSHDKKSFIREIDRRTGTILKTIEIPNLGGPHNTFRQIRKTDAGTYLVTQQNEGGKAFEYNSTGTLIRSFPDGRYVAIRLPNQNTLIAGGDTHQLTETTPDNKIVWQLRQNDLPNISLGFIAGIQRLPNGNTVFCNWGGHGNTSGPAVIEVTHDKKIIWMTTPEIPNRVSSIQIIDPEILEKPGMR